MPNIKLFSKQNLVSLSATAALLLTLGAGQVSAATYKFNPANGSVTGGCQGTAVIEIDVSGQSSNAADIEIHYDQSQVTILDSDPNLPGVQIKTGNAYETYFANQVDSTPGTILLAGGNFITSLTTKKIFATIQYKTALTATSADFTIKFDGVGATLDSNIADSNTSNDLLSSVTNGSYTVVNAGNPCTADTQAPQVQFVNPLAYQSNVPLDSNITITVTDNQSGIDINSLQFTVNGVIYTISSPEVTFTGGPLSYTFTINPAIDFPADQSSTVAVKGKDLSGNQFNQQIVFNIPPSILPPPPAPIVCKDPTDAYTNFAQVTNNVSIFKGGPLEGSFIDQIANDLGANTVLNLVTTAGFSLGFLQALTILNTPGLIYNFLAFLLGKGRGKTWGIVIDSITSKPIPFAACRLYLEGTLNVHQQTVSDTEGRYGFAIQPGSYRLEVVQSGYDKFSRSITIEKDELSYVYDVKLAPAGLGQSELKNTRLWWDKVKAYYFKVRPYLFVAGLALALFSIIVAPALVNIIIFILYVVILAVMLVGRALQKSKYAAVIDSSSNLRIPFALVKIFNIKTWELVDSQVTNTNGQFDFWGEPGEYGLLVSVRGYTFPARSQNNYPIIDEKYSAMLKIKLLKGHNRIQIYVDPVLDSSTSSTSGDKSTPKAATPAKPARTRTTTSKTTAKTSKVPPPLPPAGGNNLATPFG